MSNIDLDSILDQALDDFEDQDMTEKVNRTTASSMASSMENTSYERQRHQAQEQEKIQNLLSSVQDPSSGPILQNTLKMLSNTKEGNESVESLFTQLGKQFETNHKSTLMPDDADDGEQIQQADREIVQTLQMIGSAQRGMEGFEASKMEEVGGNMMEDMMAQFEQLGEREDYNEVRISTKQHIDFHYKTHFR